MLCAKVNGFQLSISKTHNGVNAFIILYDDKNILTVMHRKKSIKHVLVDLKFIWCLTGSQCLAHTYSKPIFKHPKTLCKQDFTMN